MPISGFDGHVIQRLTYIHEKCDEGINENYMVLLFNPDTADSHKKKAHSFQDIIEHNITEQVLFCARFNGPWIMEIAKALDDAAWCRWQKCKDHIAECIVKAEKFNKENDR